MSAEDVRAELAEVIVTADDTIDLRYGRHVAEVILASDWLAEYVATKQAEVLREAAMDVPFIDPEVADEVIDWLRACADRIAP